MPRTMDRQTLRDRKSTRLNSSHDQISYAVFCLKKKNIKQNDIPNNHANIDRSFKKNIFRFGHFSQRVQLISFRKLKTKIIFFFNDTATTEIYTLSLHDALPI